MKKILYIILTINFLLGTTSCDKFLDNTGIVNKESIETGFVIEEHADQLNVSVYASLRDGGVYTGHEGHVLFDCASADMKITRETNSVNNYTFNSSVDDKSFSVMWEKMYEAIGRCNSSIEIVPKTQAPVEKVSKYDSEAKIIRASLYYHLMMAFGTCPLVIKTIDPGDKDALIMGDATREQIYTVLINDLEEVVVNKNLPWEKNIPLKDKGHVGQGTARIVLTYLYLTRAWENNSTDDFKLAKKYAKEIIDLGGFSFEPVLYDAYYKPYSKESLFEIGTSNDAEGLGAQVVPWFVPLTPPVGADTKTKKYFGGWYKMCMTQKFYDAIEDGDVRKYLFANSEHGVNNIWAPTFLGGDKYGGNLIVSDDIDDNDWGLPVYLNSKATGAPTAWAEKLSDLDHDANWVFYRLSDVYLLYAEACIKSDDFNEGRAYINKVRERARNAWYAYLPKGDTNVPVHTPGLPADIQESVTGNELLAKLKHERRIELGGEMKRMIDIRRWSLGGADDLKNEVNISGTWSEKFKWYPKPQDQVDLSEGKIKQNDGY